ncbi:hypothetical protein BAE44_0002916 [Dichanthelium oligosanthes]|uniref:MATH domain-containing protein n=1 Tax=Dichanthelium oligosanthes TaxID=888268 RepID=A0A1E5WFE8_9POAL|nr:hypothetical protein BAE44_0002916 [Dichanthelium oligosanthes]
MAKLIEVEVRRIRETHCGNEEGDLRSAVFMVAGLDWTITVDPDEEGYVGVYVELLTKGAAAWAYVRIGLVNWTTGQADTFFSREDPAMLDAGSEDLCDFGTSMLTSWMKDLQGSRYLRGDCLKIECTVDVCRDLLAFEDPPMPKSTPRHVVADGKLGS